MKTKFGHLLFITVFMVSCGSSDTMIQTAIAETEAAKQILTFTPEPSSTFLPSPTFTIKPSATNTIQPTATDLPNEPIHLSGTGDSVVDFEKWDGLAIAEVVNSEKFYSERDM
jgi:hypothetical protein